MITVQQSVTGLRPVYNEDYFVVSSDKYSQDNFQFVCDVYVNGGGTKIARLKTFPNHTTHNGVFNVNRLIENYISKDFSLAINKYATNDNSHAYYILQFGEEYGLSSSGTTIYPNQSTGGATCFNAVFDFEDRVDYDYTDYLLTDSSGKFLTNCVSNKVLTNDRSYLYFMYETSNDAKYLRIKTYGTAGLIDSYRMINPYSHVSRNYYFVRVGCGGYNLNTLTSGDIASSTNGIYPIVGASVTYYTINFENAATTAMSETKTFYVSDLCSMTENTRVFFLNKLGGYDGFTFKDVTKKSADIKRSTFKKNAGSWTGSTVYLNSKSDHGVSQYDTSITDTITLTSDWINDVEAEWLEELFTSPDVYIDRNGTQVPIIITANSYETKQQALNQLFNITIEFQYSYNRYRQRL